MGAIYRLTGIEQAQRCLAAARGAETEVERDAWQRLASRYIRKFEIEKTPTAVHHRTSAHKLGQRAGSR